MSKQRATTYNYDMAKYGTLGNSWYYQTPSTISRRFYIFLGNQTPAINLHECMSQLTGVGGTTDRKPRFHMVCNAYEVYETRALGIAQKAESRKWYSLWTTTYLPNVCTMRESESIASNWAPTRLEGHGTEEDRKLGTKQKMRRASREIKNQSMNWEMRIDVQRNDQKPESVPLDPLVSRKPRQNKMDGVSHEWDDLPSVVSKSSDHRRVEALSSRGSIALPRTGHCRSYCAGLSHPLTNYQHCWTTERDELRKKKKKQRSMIPTLHTYEKETGFDLGNYQVHYLPELLQSHCSRTRDWLWEAVLEYLWRIFGGEDGRREGRESFIFISQWQFVPLLQFCISFQWMMLQSGKSATANRYAWIGCTVLRGTYPSCRSPPKAPGRGIPAVKVAGKRVISPHLASYATVPEYICTLYEVQSTTTWVQANMYLLKAYEYVVRTTRLDASFLIFFFLSMQTTSFYQDHLKNPPTPPASLSLTLSLFTKSLPLSAFSSLHISLSPLPTDPATWIVPHPDYEALAQRRRLRISGAKPKAQEPKSPGARVAEALSGYRCIAVPALVHQALPTISTSCELLLRNPHPPGSSHPSSTVPSILVVIGALALASGLEQAGSQRVLCALCPQSSDAVWDKLTDPDSGRIESCPCSRFRPKTIFSYWTGKSGQESRFLSLRHVVSLPHNSPARPPWFKAGTQSPHRPYRPADPPPWPIYEVTPPGHGRVHVVHGTHLNSPPSRKTPLWMPAGPLRPVLYSTLGSHALRCCCQLLHISQLGFNLLLVFDFSSGHSLNFLFTSPPYTLIAYEFYLATGREPGITMAPSIPIPTQGGMFHTCKWLLPRELSNPAALTHGTPQSK
ncbi:hypothetical protein ACRALDRAFT_1093486, partial [Sodiomyces alcalophilus JCM 7366]|uniref:uncharacterized protein n=1 Tax=Sodiomyces alcalophilus JCM 7366 TaxID=591952 RepID=UPI0039B4DB73